MRFYLPFILLATLTSLVGCVNPNEAKNCGETIEVDPQFSYDEYGYAVFTGNYCYSETEQGGVRTIDGADCCPDGYEFLAIGETGSGGIAVVCEKVCDPGQAAGQTAFVVHTLTYAFTDAMEILYPVPGDGGGGPPPGP